MILISMVEFAGRWFWVNKTNDFPAASGKEFDTQEEAMRDLRKRVPHFKLVEPPRGAYDGEFESYN